MHHRSSEKEAKDKEGPSKLAAAGAAKAAKERRALETNGAKDKKGPIAAQT